MQDGYYWIKNHSYLFQDIGLQFDNGRFSLFGKVNYLSQLIEFHTTLDLYDLSHMIIEAKNLLKEDEAMKGIIAFHDHRAQLESLTGKMCGMEFTFLPQATNPMQDEFILTTSVRIDFREILPLLSLEMQSKLKEFKIKDGFLLQGNLILNRANIFDSYFRGFFSGKNFEAGGYLFKNFYALVTYDDKKLKFEDITLSDAALILKIQKVLIELREDAFLNCIISKLDIEDFRPSLLKKPYQVRSRIKPFLIRHLSCDKIEGNLAQPDSLHGSGTLKFINTFKRENHLIDIPIEIISRLGLDIGLLIPVRGEIDFEVKNQKVVLKELKNSFSDGKRSHFYFPSNKACYIDFDGNMHVDVKMKQYVLFKITQPFTLSLRGQLSKPSFSLK
jgi:hypothetical protein